MLLGALPVHAAGCVTLAQDPRGWDPKAETLESLQQDPRNPRRDPHSLEGPAQWELMYGATRAQARERVEGWRGVRGRWFPEIANLLPAAP